MKTWYKGKIFFGQVEQQNTCNKCDKSKWTISFSDGYRTRVNERTLRKWLIPARRKFKQIDHILVSQRWKSAVIDCKTDWKPSIHRSKWGIKQDHALLSCKWKWKVRTLDVPDRLDYSELARKPDPNMATPSTAQIFNTNFVRNLMDNDHSFNVPPNHLAMDDYYDSEDEDFQPNLRILGS